MDNYTLFEAYLSKTLAEKERLAFDERLRQDSEFQTAFDDHIKIQASLDILLEDDVRAVISEVEKDQAATDKGNKFKKKVYLAAAAIALLLGAFQYMFTKEDTVAPNESQLLAEFYKPPLSTTVRGDNPVETAIDTKTSLAHYKMKEGEYAVALNHFREIHPLMTGLEKERNEWYMALCYLVIDPKTSESMLGDIIKNPKHIRRKEAQQLSPSLYSYWLA